jgi:hypothetical protein
VTAAQQRVLLKDQLLTRAKVELIAGQIEQVHPGFPAEEFDPSVVARFPASDAGDFAGYDAMALRRSSAS